MRSALCRLALLIGASGILCTACFASTDWAAKGPTEESYSEDTLTLGASVYSDTCASCHGRDGSGSFGPALLGKGHKYAYQDQRRLIERGRRSMPGFGASLSDKEIEAVLAHIRVGFFASRNDELAG